MGQFKKKIIAMKHQILALNNPSGVDMSLKPNFFSLFFTEDLVQETRVQSQVESYQRLKKWYLMPPCLTLSIIR